MTIFKNKKYARIWIVGLLTWLFLSNTIVSAFCGLLYANPDIMRYAEKGQKILFPTETAEVTEDSSKLSSLLFLRVMIGDNRIELSKRFPLNFLIDTSIDFACKDGESPLASGSYLCVCQGSGDENPLKSTIGLMSVEKLCQSDFASDLQSALKKCPDAKVYLTEYTVCDALITPVSITVKKPDGSELASFHGDSAWNSSENSSGEPSNDSSGISSKKSIHAEDVYIYNLYNLDTPFDIADHSVLEKMNLCMSSPRDVDKRSRSLIQAVDFSKGDSGDLNKTIRGLGYTIREQVNVADDYAVAMVTRRTFFPQFLLLFVIGAIGWSGVLFVLYFIRHRKENEITM